MVLDATARESNMLDSLKKFFIDEVETAKNIHVTFDTYLDIPKIAGKKILRWISVSLGNMQRGELSDISVDIHCCTRDDEEGFRLAQLSDHVVEVLSDTTQTDGMKRIDFYQSSSTGAWTNIGAFLVQDIIESARGNTPDETKFKTITARLRVASKV